jgi:hypothetical protein
LQVPNGPSTVSNQY